MPTLKLTDIIVDQRTQQRELDAENVERLAELIMDGGKFNDPLDVFTDGADCWLAHGHHRYAAIEKAGKDRAQCEIHTGDLDAAIDFSCKPLNSAHGQPENARDRKRRVMKYIERHPEKSARDIAEWTGVGKSTAHRYKDDIVPSGTMVETSDGRQYPAKQKPREVAEDDIDNAYIVVGGERLYRRDMIEASISGDHFLVHRETEDAFDRNDLRWVFPDLEDEGYDAPTTNRTTETCIVDTETGEVLEDAEVVTSTVTTKRPSEPQPSIPTQPRAKTRVEELLDKLDRLVGVPKLQLSPIDIRQTVSELRTELIGG